MQFLEGVRLAFVQIRTERLKSFFSLLGVIVGVMFLIIVVSIVEGMDRYIREDLSAVVFGVNTVTLQRNGNEADFGGSSARRRARRPRLYHADLDAVRRELSVPAKVGGFSATGGRVEADNGRLVEQITIIGLTLEILEIRNWKVERGRAFTRQEAERGVPVVILGSTAAETLFPGLDPIGRNVRIRSFPYRIIGVLEEMGTIFGQSRDNLAIAPIRSAIQAVTAPHGVVEQIQVQTLAPERLLEAKMEVEGIMRVRRGLRPGEPNNFGLITADEALSFWDNISRILFLALPGLVGISLVVGGIVIMNIMLVSVMERTREIGVRKALGARRRDIMVQFLVESVTLSGFGAVLGVAAGVGISSLIAAVSPMPAAIDAGWVAVGVSLGLIVGVVSGVYPAHRASKLDPVDALRFE